MRGGRVSDDSGVLKRELGFYSLLAYLLTMTLVSYLGDTRFGGRGVIPFGWDILLIVVISIAFYYWGIRQRVPYDSERVPERTDDGAEETQPN